MTQNLQIMHILVREISSKTFKEKFGWTLFVSFREQLKKSRRKWPFTMSVNSSISVDYDAQIGGRENVPNSLD